MDAATAGHREGQTVDVKLCHLQPPQRGRCVEAGVRGEEGQWRMMRSMGPALGGGWGVDESKLGRKNNQLRYHPEKTGWV